MSTDHTIDVFQSAATVDGIDEPSLQVNNTQPKASKHRFKPQLSCTFCRTRKLKCDRNQPCENCVKRDIASTCTFIHAGIIRDKATHIQKQSIATSPKDVQGRIRHLEELVVSLMQSTVANGSLPSPLVEAGSASTSSSLLRTSISKSQSTSGLTSSNSSLVDAFDSFGRISIEDEQPNYVGGSHWAAILESIAGLKDSLEYKEWSNQEAEQYVPSKDRGPDLLVGSVRSATRGEILASIPPRSVVDLLVRSILDSGDIAIAAVHSTTFSKEYEQFWIDPTGCPITWIGLLYAIMCLSLNIRLLSWSKHENIFNGLAQRDPREAVEIFREKTVQCLVLGNYTNPSAYTVETLIAYSLCEHFTSPDAHVGGWMTIGLAVRGAMRLGFHRDPSHYPNVSVFRGEMQRRLWCILLHLDVATSCSVGLPRMIQDSMCDTQPPRNLLDEDFDENTTVLPPSRPDSQITPIQYVNIKHGVTLVNAIILDQANTTYRTSYEEIMRLDRLLHAAYNKVPELLKVSSIEDLKTGSPDLRVRKFSINLVFEKSRAVLHRRFLLPQNASAKSPYPYSTKSCVEAAMAVLQAQALLYVETQPGEILYEHKWKTTALMTQDFLLAAMLLCLYVSHNISQSPTVVNQDAFPIKWTRDEMLQALDGSFKIWDSSKCNSKEAVKAARALKVMLSKMRKGDSSSLGNRTVHRTDSNPISELESLREEIPQQVRPSPDDTKQSTGSSPWQSDISIPLSTQLTNSHTSYGIVNDMMDGPNELNWELWDNHFNDHNNLGSTPVDLWNFSSASYSFTDPNDNVMDWGHYS